jgi:hypothetical protein
MPIPTIIQFKISKKEEKKIQKKSSASAVSGFQSFFFLNIPSCKLTL